MEHFDRIRDGANNGGSSENTTTTILKKIGVFVLVLLSLSAFALLVVITTRTIDRTQPNRPHVINNKCLKPPSITNHWEKSLKERDAARVHTKTYVLTNGKTLVDSQYRPISLILKNGKIEKVVFDKTIQLNNNNDNNNAVVSIDLKEQFVTPGLVDIHSHLGVYSLPESIGHSDGNEMTNPTLPQVRAIDALNPKDLAIHDMLTHGVTSALVLPGSGNVMGGEGVYVKTFGNSVHELLMSGAPRALKMACGENPKRVYGSKSVTPMSRMGSAWLMREKFEAARKLMLAQDEWDCQNAQNKQPDYRTRPSNLSLDGLVALLRGQDIYLMVHCYEVQDLEMAVRLSHEFGFKINSFHHALEAYKIPKLLRDNNITVSTFSDLFGYKVEAYEASVHAPKLLHEQGVKVAIKSDHPVSHAKDLMHNAAKSHYYGLDAQATLDSVTRVPAEAMMMGHRLGSLKEGYDADVVIWDRNPLTLGATTTHVFVDGELRHQRDIPVHSTSNPLENIPQVIITGKCNPDADLGSFAVQNAKVVTMNANNDVHSNVNIVVNNGNITCIGSSVECPIDGSEVVLDLQGGIVVPGFLESSSHLGLMDIQSEEETNDGSVTSVAATNVLVRDGVIMQSRPMFAAFKSGVTTSISHHIGSNIVNGQSAAFSTIGTVIDDALIKTPAALQLCLGPDSKGETGSLSGSVSGQVAILRKLFQDAHNHLLKQTASPDDPVVQVLQRKIPVVVAVHKADYIAQLLNLRQQYGFKLVLVGAAEANVLASKIAQQSDSVSVVLTPRAEGFAPTERWDSQRTDEFYGVNELIAKGVPIKNIGLATGLAPYDIRNLRFIAALVHEQSQINVSAHEHRLSWTDALSMITRNIADMYHLDHGYGRIVTGTKANFVLLNSLTPNNDNVLSFDSQVKAVVSGARLDCNPTQF